MVRRVLSLAAVLSIASACGRGQAPESHAAAGAETERQYLLERVDDAAVVQLYADQFAALPLREKTLIWHLSRAVIAGRDIYYDQRHRDALTMRRVLEAIVSHPTGIAAPTLAEIQRYTKLFWINNGPYNNLTARKFLLQTTPEALAAAAKACGVIFNTNFRAVRLL